MGALWPPGRVTRRIDLAVASPSADTALAGPASAGLNPLRQRCIDEPNNIRRHAASRSPVRLAAAAWRHRPVGAVAGTGPAIHFRPGYLVEFLAAGASICRAGLPLAGGRHAAAGGADRHARAAHGL